MKTFIRYPGNKSRHIKHIYNHLPNNISFYTYIEPFVGSGALFIHLQPSKWIINDLNEDLINVYKSVQNDTKTIIKQLKQFEKSTNFINITNTEKKIVMDKYMEKFIKLPYNTTRATHYILLNMTVFNSIITFNGVYKFKGLDTNLLRGLTPTVLTDCYFNNLRDVSILLNSNGKIYNMDYKKILKKANKNSFCFIDPPYKEDHDYEFVYNIKNNNKTNFVTELYEEVQKLDKKGVKWLMTQANIPIVRETYKQYNIIEYPVYRGFRHEYATELIIKNY